ncbi:hypothetical protein HC931_04755 [Candidatus Gracilibacteria bacterium]|nr:hypothetical protein [Candidatus Gracilibacteria bacterium]NJP22505.1 hypothetical protein [Hydrococcus sp. CRU_1_1]
MQFQNGRVDRGIHRKGDIAIAPAGLSKWQWEGEDRYLGFSFTTSFIEKVAIEALQTNPNRLSLAPQFRIRDPQIQQIGMILLCEMHKNKCNCVISPAIASNIEDDNRHGCK